MWKLTYSSELIPLNLLHNLINESMHRYRRNKNKIEVICLNQGTLSSQS